MSDKIKVPYAVDSDVSPTSGQVPVDDDAELGQTSFSVPATKPFYVGERGPEMVPAQPSSLINAQRQQRVIE